jgi:hypothetical protein
METYNIKDAVVFLKDINDPFLGSISYSKPVNPNTVVTIKCKHVMLKVPLNKIELAIFKVASKRYGFIFKSSLYSDTDVNYWDMKTEKIAQHKLQTNF